MTTTTRAELLTLLDAMLPPDPLDHDYFCPKCGGTSHKDNCPFLRSSTICAAHEAGELEFEGDEPKEPTRPGQRVRMTFDREGVFKAGDEFVVAYVCGGDVQFEGREDWWAAWWFEVIDELPRKAGE